MQDQKGNDLNNHSKLNDVSMSFYWQAYELSHDPFSSVNDPDAYFPLNSWEHHFELLQHIIKNENILLAVIADEGAGKTTFAKQVTANFADVYHLHRFHADSLFSTRKLVRELSKGFDLEAPNNETPDEQLDTQVAEVQHKDKTCLLIIDDAHFLPLETLSSLIFLLKQQSRTQMRLHIILLGDKNLEIKLSNLAKTDVGQSLVHTIHIEPLTLEETKQYILHRLNQAGLIGAAPFSQMQIERIYANSKGIPDRVNHLAQQILLDDLKKNKNNKKQSTVKRHQSKIVGGCLLVVALVAVSYILDKQGETVAPKQVKHAEAAISFAKQTETIKPVKQQVVINKSTSQPNLTQMKQVKKSTPQPKLVHVKTTKSSIHEKHPSLSTAKKDKQHATESYQVIELSSIPSISQKAKVLALRSNNRVYQLNHVAAAKPPKQYHVDVISHPALKKQFNKKVLGETLHLTKGEKQLLAEKSSDYTLQVIGLSYQKSMRDFIKKNHLQKDTHYVKTTLHGKPWYILVYGEYKTRQQAVAAIKTLPPALQKYKPFPREMKYVKVDIERG